jgi:hypothetical protein
MKLNVRRNMRMNSDEPMTRGWPAHDDLPGGIFGEGSVVVVSPHPTMRSAGMVYCDDARRRDYALGL